MNEKIIGDILQTIFPDYKRYDDCKFQYSNNQLRYNFGGSVRKIAGQLVLRSHFNLHLFEIVNVWRKHSKELEIENPDDRPTLIFTTKNQGLANSITKDSLIINDLKEPDLGSTLSHIYKDVLFGNLKSHESIDSCHSIINEKIEIDTSLAGITDFHTLPFRKVILAKRANDNRYESIYNAMSKFCERQKLEGEKSGNSQLIKLKPVFNKLFPEN